jgi:hypothetical protein
MTGNIILTNLGDKNLKQHHGSKPPYLLEQSDAKFWKQSDPSEALITTK